MSPSPPTPRPIFLLADSKPLFRCSSGASVLCSARATLPADAEAAYIGVSNGDDPAFYSIFEAAMDAVGITRRSQVTAGYTDAEREALARADLVLLSGGDVARGWDVFVRTGIGEAVVERLQAGALCVGVSAGAVHLGLQGWREGGGDNERVFDTLQLVPRIVDVHDEADLWRRLAARVRASGGGHRGLGIPFGGVVVCHPDDRLEALDRPAIELVPDGEDMDEQQIVPG